MDEEVDRTPTDTMAPWTIKSVSTATRDTVVTAARKEGLTTGQWLERRVREWTENGSPTRIATSLPASSDLVGSVDQMVEKAITLSSLPPEQKADPLVQEARRLVRAVMIGLRKAGRPMPAEAPRLAAPSPASAAVGESNA